MMGKRQRKNPADMARQSDQGRILSLPSYCNTGRKKNGKTVYIDRIS